jgi:uncharacterized protein (TIGR02117 family)
MGSHIRLCLGLLIPLLAVGCVGPVSGLYPPKNPGSTRRIYLVSHGWHTGLVVPREILPSAISPETGGEWAEIGWGDDGFYRSPGITPAIAIRAMFWRNPAVLHVVGMDDDPMEYFPNSGVMGIDVGAEGMESLADYLSNSYQKSGSGSPEDLGPGLYGNSRFYRATGCYYFPNTCNKWTARALRSGGFPISTFYSVRAANVFRQSRKFGTVHREPLE